MMRCRSPSCQLLGVSLFSCSVSQFLSWGVGLATRFPLPSREKGFGSPQSVCRLSRNCLFSACSLLSNSEWFAGKERTITPKASRSWHKGLAEENKSIQPKHLQPRLCNFSFLWKSSDSISYTCHFNNCLQSAPSSLALGLRRPTAILPNSGLSKDSPDGETTARGNQCGPAHTLYIPSGYD